MKVLDLNKIASYNCMRESLVCLGRGDLEGALMSALTCLTRANIGSIERIDIALYVAKIYSEMGEFRACMNLLFRSLRYRTEEGRIYAMLSYNYYKCGEDMNGDYYHCLADEWNESHGGILDVRGYEKSNVRSHIDAHIDTSDEDNEIINSAWEYAVKGDSRRARSIIMSLGNRCRYRQYELIISLDIVDECHSIEEMRLLRDIMNNPISDTGVMRLFYVFDRTHNMNAIVRLAEKAIAEKKCTARLAEIYATALINMGRYRDALSILGKLDSIFGDALPSIRALYYMANVRDDLFAPIYRVRYEESDYAIARDEQLMLLMNNKKIEDIISSRNLRALIYSHYEEGIVTALTRRLTAKLMSTDMGVHILEDLLLDVTNTSALMRVHIVRALIDKVRNIRYVYDNIYVESTYVPPRYPLDDISLAKYKDEYTYMILSGEV